MGAVQHIDFHLTPEEYLERERAAETKSEYFNGEIVAMAGAKWAHNVIAGRMLTKLTNAMEGRPCAALGSDMKVRIERANLFRYPDVSALCGPVDFYDDEEDVYCNPALIVEVLSPSTEKYDRTDKFGLYRLIDSLREFVLVAQDRVEVEVFRKGDDGRWRGTALTDGEDMLRLESVGCEFRVAELYVGVEIPAPGPGSDVA